MVPENIEGPWGNPLGPPQSQLASKTKSSFGLDSSSDGDALASQQLGPFKNAEHIPDENGVQTSQYTIGRAPEEQHDRQASPQNNSWDEVDVDNLENSNIDARSDGSSESGLFVPQDAEVKSEYEHNGDHINNGPAEKEGPVKHDRRYGSEEYVREESHHSDEDSDLFGDDDGIFDNGDQAEEGQHDQLQVEGQFGKDDDNDCMVVEANDIPADINAKFAEFEFCKFPQAAGNLICTSSRQIKIEDPGHSFIIPDSDNEADPDFEIDEDDVLSDGERPRKRRRPPPKSTGEGNETLPLSPIQAIIGGVPDAGGEGEWQEPTDDELMEMYTQRDELNALQAQRALSLLERVTLAQVTSRIATVEKVVSQQIQTPSFVPPASTEDKRARRLAKTAQEYWEREYAEKGSGVRNIVEATKRKRATKKPKKGDHGGPGGAMERKFMGMLKDVNPIMARAAQGKMEMPGPIQATTRNDQIKAMKDFLFKVTGNPGQRRKCDDQRLLEKATSSFGHCQVRVSDGRWRLAGKRMISTLYNHQLVGVSWMLGQEFSPNGPYGGILADQMGLGKTVQVLATMSVNRPTQADVDAGCHQTLIVAPATAINQWEREVTKHCDKSFIRLVHHYRAAQKIKPEMWKMADVILVSFNEVTNALPSDKVLKLIAGKKRDEEEWQEEYDQALGELLKHRFFRVVLDEGHAIRNDYTKTARACFNLTSKYRWILSGTPVHNSIHEFHSYFRFLGAHWGEDPAEFAKQFGNIEKDDVRDRLDVVIRSTMLRRRVDDHFLGSPIMEIPKTNNIEVLKIDLTIEERLIYRRLESRVRDNMSSHLKDGTASKRVTTYLAYLTRLRQAVAHPFLLEGVLKHNFTLEDFHYIRKQLSIIGGKTPMHLQIQRWVNIEYDLRFGAEGAGSEVFGRSQFGYAFDMDAELAEMEAGTSMEEVICRLCSEFPVNPQITECGHTFCSECIEGELNVRKCCPTCHTVLWKLSVLREPDRILGAQADEDSDAPKPTKKRKKTEEDREVGDDSNLAQPKMKDSSKWVEQYDKCHPNKRLLGSAKTVVVKNQILKWQKEAPDDKIIVFVSWAKLACIIGRMLQEESIPFLYYFGDLTKDQKEAAILNFQEKPNIKVLVSSARCGGQALNLNFANRVISVDQWWNTAMEAQAFGRVHRIGQEKETYFTKIVVRDSIDEMLLNTQQGKEKRISDVLKEGIDRKEVPTLEKLITLFGLDNDGNYTDKAAQGGSEREAILLSGDGEGGGTRSSPAGDTEEGGV